jgi:hypothetical protein
MVINNGVSPYFLTQCTQVRYVLITRFHAGSADSVQSLIVFEYNVDKGGDANGYRSVSARRFFNLTRAS